MKYHYKQRGFVALMSTIIISAILIALMMTIAAASFYARFDALGEGNKRQAQALAEACIDVALLALATSTDAMQYDPAGEVVSVTADADGPTTCTIKDILHNPSSVTIDAYASSDNSYDNVSATASLSPSIQIISWSESE
jgi:type II secretory pathway pseudopilin PulG